MRKEREKFKELRRLKYLRKYNLNKQVFTLPLEIMIEVEPRCNFDCVFCFNKKTFASEGRDFSGLSGDFVYKIIDHVVDLGIKKIRFTGGEPLLRNDIFELLDYAKRQGLFVTLNTNGSFLTKEVVQELDGKVDNVLVSLESINPKEEEKIARHKGAFEKKIRGLRNLIKLKNIKIGIGTVATSSAINDFSKMNDLVNELNVNYWSWFRPIGKKMIDEIEFEKLAKNILAYGKQSDKVEIRLVNPFPFCAISNLKIVNKISLGAIYDEGNSRMVVDARGFLKPDYFIGKNIGDPLNILEAWNSKFMKQIRNSEFLPIECRGCLYQYKCRGGSRYEAYRQYGRYNDLDPLADVSRKKQ